LPSLRRSSASECGAENPKLTCGSLAKAAMYRALVQRPSRLTPVIHLLKRDIDSRENRGIATRVADITLRGWAMIVNRM
jgi:hypothetical protein